MTRPTEDVPPEVNPKWLELRQKHQNESSMFQTMVTRNREEFEARVDRQRKDLLAQHSKEEREFWSKNNRTGPVRAGSKATFARTQPPSTARTSVAPPKKTPAPASRPITPRTSVQPPVTPARASQHPRYADVPPAPKRPTQRAAGFRKPVQHEIIDLCSDDEKTPHITKKQPVVQRKAAQMPVDTPINPHQATVEDTMDVDEAQIQPKDPFSMPEATLELFGGSSSKTFDTPTRSTVKSEDNSPHLASPFARMDVSPSKTPNREPVSPSMHRASTAPRQFRSPGVLGSRASPSIPGSGHVSPAGFMNRAASVMPSAPFGLNAMSPSIKSQSDRLSTGTTSPTGLVGRSASVVPPSSSNIEQWPSPQMVPPSSELRSLPWHRLARQNQQLRKRLIALSVGSVRETGDRDDVQDIHDGGVVSEMIEDIQDASPRGEDTTMSEVAGVCTLPSSAPARPSSQFEQTGSDINDPFTTTVAETLKPQNETQQLPSPPPSCVSAFSESITHSHDDVSAPSSSFKKPSLPASAASSTIQRPIAAQARHVRAGTTDSRTSSVTLSADSRQQRGVSIASRTSDTSGQTSATRARKRKPVVDLSSDSDSDSQSDYAPSENASPVDPKPTKPIHTAKKTKANDGTELAAKPKPTVHKVMGKNNYGFRLIPGKTALASRAPAPQASAHSQPRRTATAKNPPVARLIKRRAALAARNKLQDMFDSTEAFETDLAIQEADRIESARLPEDMHRMSLTPAPEPESAGMLAEQESPRGFKEWSELRSTGDRMARWQDDVEDDDSEVDTSEYKSVDGVIVRNDGEKGLTSSEQAMTFREMGGGRRGGEEV